FVRNVLYAIGNSGNVELIDSAKKLQLDLDPVVKDAADWAIAKLKGSTNG
ncbi:MAG: epoxyqueuosine reductase, partial [Rhodobacterales bacterium]|nr:epoxyqueuosine reductase [Rhodobacterales bacterium]